MIDTLKALTVSTEKVTKALVIMTGIVQEQRSEIERLRKIIEETVPHRLKETDND